MARIGFVCFACLVIVAVVVWGVSTKHSKPESTAQIVLAPGYQDLQFEPPLAGSYKLPVLGQATDGQLLDGQGGDIRLHRLLEDKITILSFIYTFCSDVNGCPLATSVLHQIAAKVKTDASLSNHVRLVTISFDPARDTPEIVKKYGEAFNADTVDWHFLTAGSEAELQPVLDGYGQSVRRDVNKQNSSSTPISHILRVFLIDRKKQIRNIYSVSMLHADTVYNDIKTLHIAEQNHDSSRTHPDSSHKEYPNSLSGGSNSNAGRSTPSSIQNSAVKKRFGSPTNLYQFWKNPPLGLPEPNDSGSYRMSPESIALGRKLFFDRRLSLNNTISCAMCHIPEQGFTSNQQATSVGFEGSLVRRNAPTIYNVGFAPVLFHDGREYTLENQVWSPLLASNEMANPSIGFVIEKIKGLPKYNRLFAQAFAKPPTVETIGAALAHYQRTLNSADSSFDRWYYGSESDALNPSEIRGFNVFNGKAGCYNCHKIGSKNALFSDYELHNTGVAIQRKQDIGQSKTNVRVSAGQNLEVDRSVIESVGAAPVPDLGAYEISQDPRDRWKYRTPSLRNVALTAPYMHDGSIGTLEQVIEFYDAGGIDNENLDERIVPLNLNQQEKSDLVAFLKTLNGGNNEILIEDAMSAEIGDTGALN